MVVQIQPTIAGLGFALQAINREGGSTSSVASLVSPSAAGYAVESVSSSPFTGPLTTATTVMTPGLPSIMQNYWRHGTIPTTAPLARAVASGSGDASTSRAGTAGG